MPKQQQQQRQRRANCIAIRWTLLCVRRCSIYCPALAHRINAIRGLRYGNKRKPFVKERGAQAYSKMANQPLWQRLAPCSTLCGWPFKLKRAVERKKLERKNYQASPHSPQLQGMRTEVLLRLAATCSLLNISHGPGLAMILHVPPHPLFRPPVLG